LAACRRHCADPTNASGRSGNLPSALRACKPDPKLFGEPKYLCRDLGQLHCRHGIRDRQVIGIANKFVDLEVETWNPK
jgi:hypothetical protein